MSNASDTPDSKEMSSLDKERMHDVQLLISNLFRREETTVLMILDCLYDVGAHHWVDQKVRIRWGRRVVVSMTRPIKPLFKAIAIRWFNQNVPELLTNWLYRKVSFEPKDDESEQLPTDSASALPATDLPLPGPMQPTAPYPNPKQASLPAAGLVSVQDVERLQKRVRVLAGVSIVAIAALIGTLIS